MRRWRCDKKKKEAKREKKRERERKNGECGVIMENWNWFSNKRKLLLSSSNFVCLFDCFNQIEDCI